MTLRGAVFCRLLLISGLVGNAFAVKEGKNLEQSGQLPNDSQAIKIDQIGEKLEEALTKALDKAEAAKETRKCLALKELLEGEYIIAEGTVFHYNQARVDWFGARDYCQQKGMRLAMLKTLSLADAVNSQMHSLQWTYPGLWLFGNDLGRTPGNFHWADRTPVEQTLWYAGEPNQFGAGKEACVHLPFANPKLFDDPCQNFLYALCQVPKALSSCF